MHDAGIDDPLFMQDNPPIQPNLPVCFLFKDNDWIAAEHGCTPNSIEHVWVDAHQTSATQAFSTITSYDQEALVEVLLEKYCRESLYTSMPRRVAAVIKAEGWCEVDRE